MPYRYEDLGDENFQRLCGALLAHLDQAVQLPPLGQSDGGFDGYRRRPGTQLKVVGHQVKFTGKPESIKDPVSWIMSKLNEEKPKLKRMSANGTENYLIISNVPATSKPGRGRMDRIDAQLSELGREVGLRLWVWWRNDLDARLDLAPAELKFAYPDMLVGADAIRALIGDSHQSTSLRDQAELVKSALATQFERESTVGFRQGRLEGVPLHLLFVDVSARARGGPQAQQPLGAVRLFLSKDGPQKAIVYGAPGQGKSTLVQMMCQEHRARVLDEQPHIRMPEAAQDTTRIPFKIVLRDLAVWLKGRDPFSADERKRPVSSVDSVESFAAHMLTTDSGGLHCGVDELLRICNRYPSLFAFDGLDEVADAKVREKVVRLIEEFEVRAGRWDIDVRVVVTSRPSFDRLAEPSSETHHPHVLEALGEKLRIEYLRKWAATQELKPADRRELERIFRERSGQEHVRELGTNPMQLTILLYLIRQRGEAVPERRTDLYTDYLQAYLDRESEKSEDVRTYRPLLEEVTAFLGWHLQSRAESDSGNGRVAKDDLIREMKHFLVDEGRATDAVDVLFSAVTTRVWALTSRVAGTFEFDVQSIREYFAAKFLYDRAPVTRAGTAAFGRFSEVVNRAYWANTARLMAGMFRHGEKAQLADDLIGLIRSQPFRFWPRRIATTLLRDGVFDGLPSPTERLVEAIADDLGIRLMRNSYLQDGVGALPVNRGGRALTERVQRLLETEIANPLTELRASVLRMHLPPNQLAEWAIPHLQAVETRSHWLAVVSAAGVGGRVKETDLSAFDSGSEEDAAALLSAGVGSKLGSTLDDSMVRALLDGRVATFEAMGTSRAAALGGVLDTDRFAERAAPSRLAPSDWSRQASALLERLAPDLAVELLGARRSTAGQKGTTLMFARLADTVHNWFGKNWLANEIALIAAAAPELRLGHMAGKDVPAFGVGMRPSALIRDLVTHRKNLQWWQESRLEAQDQLDSVTWIVAAIVGAAPPVLSELLPIMSSVLADLEDRHYALASGALSRFGRRVGAVVSLHTVLTAASMDARLASLLVEVMGDEDKPLPPLEGATERWQLVRSFSIWSTLRPNRKLTSEHAAALANAGADVNFGAPKDWSLPGSLRRSLTPQSPWALLEWHDRDIEYETQQLALSAVAERERWN